MRGHPQIEGALDHGRACETNERRRAKGHNEWKRIRTTHSASPARTFIHAETSLVRKEIASVRQPHRQLRPRLCRTACPDPGRPGWATTPPYAPARSQACGLRTGKITRIGSGVGLGKGTDDGALSSERSRLQMTRRQLDVVAPARRRRERWSDRRDRWSDRQSAIWPPHVRR